MAGHPSPEHLTSSRHSPRPLGLAVISGSYRSRRLASLVPPTWAASGGPYRSPGSLQSPTVAVASLDWTPSGPDRFWLRKRPLTGRSRRAKEPEHGTNVAGGRQRVHERQG